MWAFSGDDVSLKSPPVRSSIESEPALVLGPLRSLEEQRQEQQLQEIQLRRQERERRAAGDEGGAKDDSPPIQEKADDLIGPFHYDFSYWARSETLPPSTDKHRFRTENIFGFE